jgi:hypothetical protein
VLDNDDGVDPAATVELATDPMYGMANIDLLGVLRYEPAMDFLGDDTLLYRITNPDGTTALGTVAVTVGCATCAIGGSVTLTWDPNAPSDNVMGYRLYSGITEDTSMLTLTDDIMVTRPGFDPAAPMVHYDAWSELHLRIGTNVCFALTAYNSAGESGFSNVACKVVTADAMRFGL